jgi:glycosyltransferase involved in cell wall biosynthesis
VRVLFVQPSMQPPGGGNGVAAWMVQALKDVHDVTVLTWWPFDVAEVNRFWGTSIGAGEVRRRRVPGWLRAPLDALPLPLSLLRTAVMARYARRLAAGYDVAVTANNETDVGHVAVQYVHYPWNLYPRPAVDYRWYHLGLLLSLYYRLCQAVSGFSATATRRNLTLVNSDWTGRLVAGRYGMTSRTVYPPVAGDFPLVPWEAREPGFVCLGRIAPEKEIERVMEILTAVRAAGLPVRLHIVGTPGDPRYYQGIVARARAAADWIQVHENLPRAGLVALVARQRYGIHGMREEHFGMAPAEMVRAGCIVWVPAGGGQVEIVEDTRLIYRSVEDAVAKITRVLAAPDEQAALRKDLAARAEAFSIERFTAEIRRAVADAAGTR